MPKLRAALQGRNDILIGNTMDIQHFRQALRDCGGLTEHEILTVARHYQDRQNEPVDNGTMAAVAQEHLRRNGFSDFAPLEKHLSQSDTG